MSDPVKPAYRRSGWRKLKQENERGFEANFAPLRLVMQRSELLGSMIELFVSAIAGIGRIGMGAARTDAHRPGRDENYTPVDPEND